MQNLQLRKHHTRATLLKLLLILKVFEKSRLCFIVKKSEVAVDGFRLKVLFHWAFPWNVFQKENLVGKLAFGQIHASNIDIYPWHPFTLKKSVFFPLTGTANEGYKISLDVGEKRNETRNEDPE